MAQHTSASNSISFLLRGSDEPTPEQGSADQSEYEDRDRRRSPADDDDENSIHTTGLFLHIRNLGLKYTTETQMFLEHFSEGSFDLIRGHSSFSWTSYDHS